MLRMRNKKQLRIRRHDDDESSTFSSSYSSLAYFIINYSMFDRLKMFF